jgi:hypothetical protein
MSQLPRAIGLALCDQVIFERGTNKPTLVGCFSQLTFADFPSEPRPFDVFASLTDGRGVVPLRFFVTHLDTDEEIYYRLVNVAFPEPLRIVTVCVRIRRFSFPAAGVYLVAFRSGEEVIAEKRLLVFSSGEIT